MCLCLQDKVLRIAITEGKKKIKPNNRETLELAKPLSARLLFGHKCEYKGAN